MLEVHRKEPPSGGAEGRFVRTGEIRVAVRSPKRGKKFSSTRSFLAPGEAVQMRLPRGRTGLTPLGQR